MQYFGNLFGQERIAQLHRAEIDRHAQMCESLAVPQGQGAAGQLQHQFAHLVDQAQFLRQGDEIKRRDPMAVGVLPANQGLAPQHRAGAAVHQRLVVHLEALECDRFFQRPLHGRALGGHGHHGRVEAAVGAFAHLLGLVHGDVGALHQAAAVASVLWKEADADGGGGAQLLPGQGDRLGQLLQQLGGCRQGMLGFAHVRKYHHELVPTEPGHDVVLAHGAAQALCRHAKKLVPYAVAHAVVDALEVVHVEEQHGQPAVVAPRVGHELVQPCLQRVAVGQAGQGVVVRQAFDGARGVALLGDVGVEGDQTTVRYGGPHQINDDPVGPYALHAVVCGVKRLGREICHESFHIYRAVFTPLGIEARQFGKMGALVDQLAGKAQQADGLVVHQHQVQILVEDAHAARQVVGQGLEQRVLLGQGGLARLVLGDIGVAGDEAHGTPVGLHGAALDQVRAARGPGAFEPVGLKPQGPFSALLYIGFGVTGAELTALGRVADQVLERHVGIDPRWRQVEHLEKLLVPAFEAQLFVKHRDALRQVRQHAAQVQGLVAHGRGIALALGDVGVDADEAAAGQGRANDVEHDAVRALAHKAVRFELQRQLHALAGLFVRIARAVFATAGIEVKQILQ